MGDGALQASETEFTLTADPSIVAVAEDVARSRGDFPPEESLEKPVELVLPGDEEEDFSALPEEEVEEEQVADPEVKDDAKDTPKEKDTPKDVPYGRFADKVREVDELKAKIAELEKNPPSVQQDRTEEWAHADSLSKKHEFEDPIKQEKQPEFNLTAKYKEYADLVSDGETEKAAAVMNEIDTWKDQQADLRMQRMLHQSKERQSAESFVSEIAEKHAEFFNDPINLDLFDRAKVLYMQQGMPLASALKAAADRFFPPEQTAKVDVKEEEPVDETAAELERLKKEKKKDSLTKAVEAAAKQPPPASGGKGMKANPAIKPNALNLSEAERKAMSERDRRIARGDIV